MLKFIVDTQLPPSLAIKLCKAGFDAVHTTKYKDGHLMNDKVIREIAVSENRIIITKDSDFLDHFILRGSPPKVFLIELGNISNVKLFSLIDANLVRIINHYSKENTSLLILQKNTLLAY